MLWAEMMAADLSWTLVSYAAVAPLGLLHAALLAFNPRGNHDANRWLATNEAESVEVAFRRSFSDGYVPRRQGQKRHTNPNDGVMRR